MPKTSDLCDFLERLCQFFLDFFNLLVKFFNERVKRIIYRDFSKIANSLLECVEGERQHV